MKYSWWLCVFFVVELEFLLSLGVQFAGFCSVFSVNQYLPGKPNIFVKKSPLYCVMCSSNPSVTDRYYQLLLS